MRKIFALAVAVLMALLLISCEKSKEEPYHKNTTTMRISAILPHNDFSYWSSVADGILEKADELPVDAKVYMPQLNYNIPQMTELIRQQTAAQVDAIIVQGIEDEEYLETLEKARKQGIQIVFVDTDIPEFADHLYVGTDNYQAGFEMGRRLIEVSGGCAKVAIISGAPEYPNLNLRIDGIRDAVAEEEEIQIQRVDYDYYDALTILELYHEISQESPDVDTLLCVEGTAAHTLGIAGYRTQIFENLIGFDDSVEALAGVRSGLIDGLIVQQNREMGKICVEELYRWKETGAYSSNMILTGVSWLTAEDLPEEESYAEEE